jgi:acyl dehydratase
VNFRHPVINGNTAPCSTQVLAKHESKSRPGAGTVKLHHHAYNQNSRLVAECRRQAFIRMRPK